MIIILYTIEIRSIRSDYYYCMFLYHFQSFVYYDRNCFYKKKKLGPDEENKKIEIVIL